MKVNTQAGFGLIEIIVAMGILVIIATTAVTTIVGSYSTNRLSNEETEATLYAQQGIEAARSLRNQDWTTVFTATDCSSGCGVDSSGGNWVWSGSNSTDDGFTRTITVEDVQREGEDDPDTKLVTAAVTWDFSPTRQNTVSVQAYLTNFIKAIGGDWQNPTVVGTIDLSGNQNAMKVAVNGNYAYVVRQGSPDFSVINISNPTSPSVVGTLDLDGDPFDVAVSGNYAYVASGSNSQELQVVSITNPASPSLAGSLNLPRNNDLYTVWVNGTTVYAGRGASQQENEFYVFNVSNPTSPSLLGSLEIGDDVNSITAIGSTVYLATDGNSSELVTVNASVPALPVQVDSDNLPGNTNAEAVAAITGLVVVGDAAGNVNTFSLPTLLTPTSQGTYDAGFGVNDISLNDDGSVAFLATENNSEDFQVLDISTLASPTQLGFLDLGGNINGVAYSNLLERVAAVGDNNSAEVEVISP